MKKIFKLGIISATVLSPLIALSATTTTKKAELDKDFDTFSDLYKSIKTKEFETNIENLLSYLQSELNQINIAISEFDKSKSMKEYNDLLSKFYYLNKLVSFFDKNKAEIIKNPEKYGFNTVFLNALSTQKNINVGKVVFNKKTYSNVNFGKDKAFNYEDLIKPDGTQTSEKQEVNAIEKKFFEKTVQAYFENLKKEFKKIIIGKDYPKFDFEVKWIKNKTEEKTEIFPKKDKSFKDWNDFIINSYKNKFTAFDLENNKIMDDSPQKNPSPVAPPDDPTISFNPTETPKPYDSSKEIFAIPSLVPYFKYSFIKGLTSIHDAKNQFDKNKNQFFFVNPINTRYDYKVEALEVDGDKLMASVNIIDLIKSNTKNKLTRSYQIEIPFSTQRQDSNLETIEKNNSFIQKKFQELYSVLGATPNLDYGKLSSNLLRNTLYTIVNNASKFINENLNTLLKSSAGALESVLASIVNLKIGNSKTNDYFAFNLLAKSFSHTHQKITEFAQNKVVNEKIKKAFKDNNLNSEKLNDFNALITNDVDNIIAISSQNTMNFVFWFDKLLKQYGSIHNNLMIYSNVVKNSTDDSANSKTELIKNYELMDKQLNKNHKKISKTATIVSSISMTIGLLLLIISSLMTFKFKTNKKILLISAMLIAISVVIIIVGGLFIVTPLLKGVM